MTVTFFEVATCDFESMCAENGRKWTLAPGFFSMYVTHLPENKRCRTCARLCKMSEQYDGCDKHQSKPK